ncbi:hypothetical protein BLNAU_4601 [Blattamonas nauphoetae]|uniref:Biogenesis of lysosome-related organelles complex 1 subunit 7 n=1 Tax=Blattamonas nauphoetae TaxID=2049346 RepID=A0ABQ9Y9L2_9EUKA|nr:hypothetical protein BLNAU_4601 [Blattamonas nauphoetae]
MHSDPENSAELYLSDQFHDRYRQLLAVLEEVRQAQSVALQNIVRENETFSSGTSNSLKEISTTFQKIPSYQAKLKSCSKMMKDITKQTEKLKQRVQALPPVPSST